MPGYALVSPTYEPALRLISDITNATNTVVTTSFDHGYLAGLIVRITVPEEFGMRQLDKLVGTIIEVPTSDTFTLDIDTTLFDVFNFPDPEPWYINTYPSVAPIGEINSSLIQATKNVL